MYDDPPARSIGRWLSAMDKMVDLEFEAARRIGEDVSTTWQAKSDAGQVKSELEQ